MATKEKKGAKFGRHARNPSSKMQMQRTAKNKRLRIEKAIKTHGAQSCVSPTFPKVWVKRPMESVILSDNIKRDWSNIPVHMLFVSGHLVEVSPHASDIAKALTTVGTRHSYSHEILHPHFGRREIVESRYSN